MYPKQVRTLLLGLLTFALASCGDDDVVDRGRDASVDAADRDGAASDASDEDAPSPTDAGTDAGPPLMCDPGFAVPADARAGAALAVAFTHATGFTHIGLRAEGPGAPTSSLTDITGPTGGPFTWHYDVTGHAAGVLTLVFTADMGATEVARCQVRVVGDVADAGTDAGMDAGPPPPPGDNRFGIGFVSAGNDARQMDLAADLAGPGGYVKLIFVGVRPGMSGPTEEWISATRLAYERDLVPVVRFAPDWGDRRVRNQSDGGSNGLRYTALGASYANIVRGLPIPAGARFYVEVHNEPNLCYEWLCDRGVFPEDLLRYERMAEEYASMLRDVADAVHALGDARVLVTNGGLAPGGVRSCGCNGTSEGSFEPGITAREFLSAMASAVPGVFDRIDVFASHAYPASGEGFGFFEPYDRSGPGLRFFESELATIGRPSLPVLLTETGWPRQAGGTTFASEDQQAQWTVQAYDGVWGTHPNVLGIMPFILQDGGTWDGFAWVAPDGSPRRVYRDMRARRCRDIPGRCP